MILSGLLMSSDISCNKAQSRFKYTKIFLRVAAPAGIWSPAAIPERDWNEYSQP
jgi:hypothetical protein